MNQSRGPTRVSAALLALICLFAMARELGLLRDFLPAGGIALLIVAALEWRNMAVIARVILGVALAFAAIVYLKGNLSSDVLVKAVERATFFALFVISLDILRAAAMSSRMILESGRTLVNQRPGRRYAMITIGAHVFAMLLNVGTLNLLGTMMRRSIETAQDITETVREIRLRRMSLALLRGFTSFTLWAPTSVTVLVVLAAVPGMNWYHFVPLGAATAAGYLLFGWVLDRLSYPRAPQQAHTPDRLPTVLRRLIPLVLLTLGILSATVLTAWLSGMRPIGALLICVTAFGFGWIILQHRHAGWAGALRSGSRRILTDVIPGFVTLRSEVAILASAGFLAAIVPSQVDTQELGLFVSGLGLNEGWMLVLFMWLVVSLAPLGLNPLISVSAGLEVVARLAGFTFNPYMLAFAGTMSWALATGTSPFGTTVRLTARAVDKPPLDVGLLWNLPFSLYILAAASVALLVFS